MPTETEAKPFVCRHCKAPLGNSRPDRLTLGYATVSARTMLCCTACGTLNLWRPDVYSASTLDTHGHISNNQPH